jgi:RNA polymerase sigma-70 factor (ECF subfamily)
MTFVKYKKDTVSDLIDRIKAGDKTAFGELYVRYVKTVFNKCLSFTRDRAEAEDITQDIFVKVYEKLQVFNNKNFGAWLMRLTYNHCVDHSRKASKNRNVSETFENLEVEDSVEDIEAELMEIKLQALEEILTKIDPTDRSMLILKYQEDKKIKELADLFGIGESAVKMRLSRARLHVIEKYRTEYNGGK